jgi:hypothetical protein
MSNKFRGNTFDKLVDDLTQRFSNIKDFNLLFEDEKGKTLFAFIAKRFSELQQFRTLIINYYLPAANKSSVDGRNELRNSKYKNLFQFTDDDLQENYRETIRFAYVGVFHKFENYINDLIANAENIISGDDVDARGTLEKYVRETFKFNIKDWKAYPIVIRLNWICNCIKHYDGYPLKDHVPNAYKNLPKDKRMIFTKEQLSYDIDQLVQQNIDIMRQTFLLSQHKMLYDQMDSGERLSAETDSKLLAIKKAIILMITQIKKLAEME